MSDRERDDTGQFRETVTLEAVLEVFDEVRGPVITSSDVAEALECTTEAARQKLTRLYDRGEVDKRKTGRTTVWWYTGGERITPDERGDGHAERARERQKTRRPEEPVETADDTTNTEPEREPAPDAEDAVAALDLPGSGANLEGRRAAVRAIYEYLKTHGQGQRSEFKEVVDADATGYNSFNSFYTNCMDNGGVLAELPGVQSPGEGGHTYTYDPTRESGVYDPTEEF